MFCSNGSSAGMATLLQQKSNNCMKTLTNGGVVGGGTSGGSSNNLNSTPSPSVAPLQQTTRLLLPHEMVNLPATANIVTPSTGICSVSSAGNVTSLSGGPLVVIQQHSQQVIQQSLPHESNASHIQFSNQVNHVNQFNRYLVPSILQSGSTTYLPATTSINHIKNAPSTSSHILIATTSSNVVTAVSTMGGGTVPLTAATLAQHNQNMSHYEQTQSTQIHRDVAVTSSIISKSNIAAVSQHYDNSSSDRSHGLHSINAAANANSTGNIEESIVIDDDGYDNSNHPPGSEAAERKRDGNPANGDIQTEGVVDAADQDADPEIDIVINNVVCSFSVRCHLNLREIALNGFNVEFRRENGMVTMKLRRPYTTASIWSSGRITCTGATSEDQAKIAARRYARCLQKLGFHARFHNFRVVNVLGTCSMPWAIKIVNFSERFKKDASYEPELHPGVTYKLKYPKATLKIFSTGSITVTAGSVAHVQAAIEHIFPLVYEFRKKRTVEDMELLRAKQTGHTAAVEEVVHSPIPTKRRPFGLAENDPTEDIMYVSDVEEIDEAEEDL